MPRLWGKQFGFHNLPHDENNGIKQRQHYGDENSVQRKIPYPSIIGTNKRFRRRVWGNNLEDGNKERRRPNIRNSQKGEGQHADGSGNGNQEELGLDVTVD